MEGITLSHLNIRQSITILLAKLITIDVVVAALVIGFYWLLSLIGDYFELDTWHTFIFLLGFILAGIFKISITVWVVLLWLNEYYEITPEYIYHKKGLIFRTTQEYRIDQVRRIEIKDSFLGEIFNFATITFFDIRLNKTIDFYLIHNPTRYINILKQIKPTIEILEDHTNLPFLPKERVGVDFE